LYPFFLGWSFWIPISLKSIWNGKISNGPQECRFWERAAILSMFLPKVKNGEKNSSV
jgi:hypothetical protein